MFKKLIAAAFLCASWTRAGLCAPTFELEDGVRLASASVHCVTPVPGGYRLYFSTPSAYAVFSASSTDGLAWTIEPGVRLSTRAAFLDASSITAMGLYYDAALAGGPYHAYYVGLSTAGDALLSARSADGLTWTRDDAFSLLFSSGAARLRSPKPYFAGSGKVNLYYIRDSGGAPDPADYRIYGLKSLDDGATFSGETLLLNTTGPYQIDVSTLTDGRLRLFIAAPDLGVSTVTRVLAADSADGSSFAAAPETVFSTAAAANELSGIAVARSTETFRWRLYLTSRLNSSATTYIYSALTSSPVITGFTPGTGFIDDPVTDFTLTGEVFSSTPPAVSLVKGTDIVPVVSVTRVSDLQLTVRANPAGAALGAYTVTVANPDGRSASRGNSLRLDFRPGFVVMTDNLFRPLKGEKAQIAATVFYPGNITARLYDLNGGKVRTLYDGAAAVSPAVNTFFWDGGTDSGATAASGLYLLRLKGPKTDVKKKIVLIK